MSCPCSQDNGSVGFEHKNVGLQGVGSEHCIVLSFSFSFFSFCSPSLLLPTDFVLLSPPLCSPPLVILLFFLHSPGQFRQYFWSDCYRQTTMLSKMKKTHQCQLKRPLNIDRIKLELGQWACSSWGGSLKLVLCKNTCSFFWFPNMAFKNLMIIS